MHSYFETIKVSELSDDDIQDRINEIYKRMGAAHELGGRSPEIFKQLQILLDFYEDAKAERLESTVQKMIDDDPKLGRISIDIDWPDPAGDEDD